MKGKKNSAERHKLREDALRPCAFLGYDRDTLGMHLLSCRAYKIAEAQFRRAIWLNPYEPRFKAHLAFCLHKQNRDEEACMLLDKLPREKWTRDMVELSDLLSESTREQERKSRIAEQGHDSGE